MSLLTCLNPIRIKNIAYVNNKRKNIAYSNIKLSNSNKSYFDDDNIRYMYVPCNKCKNCLSRSSNEKAVRTLDELYYYNYDFLSKDEKKELEYSYKLLQNNVLYTVHTHHQYKACFITLTYRDDAIPENYSLCRRDFQLFLKRLRRRLETDCLRKLRELSFTNSNYYNIYKDKLFRKEYLKKHTYRVKFSGCGEYGEHFNRPHYHLLLFNVPPIEHYYKIMGDCWKLGKVQIEAVRNVSASSQYITKISKYVVKNNSEDYYDKNIYILKTNKEPSFVQCSRSFGKRYCIKNADILYSKLYRDRYVDPSITSVSREKIHYREPLPRQYCIWLQHYNNKYSDIFEKRKLLFKDYFNKTVEMYSRDFNVNVNSDLYKNSDDFYDLENHKDLLLKVIKHRDYSYMKYKHDKMMLSSLSVKQLLNIYSINSSNDDDSCMKTLKAGECFSYFNLDKSKYITYWGNGSAPRSVSRDFTNYVENLIHSKIRYKKYLNTSVFSKIKKDCELSEMLDKIDNFISKRFNYSSSDYSVYTSNYLDIINDYSSSVNYDDYYFEYVTYNSKKRSKKSTIIQNEFNFIYDDYSLSSQSFDNDYYKNIFESEIITFN